MNCKKEKLNMIKGLLLILLFGSFMAWAYSVTEAEKENYNQNLQAFNEGKTLQCKKELVSKKSAWKLLKESNNITNEKIKYHINMCKVVGE